MKLQSALVTAIFASLALQATAVDDDANGTLGPWRKGDMFVSTTSSDDRPNAASEAIVARDYRALMPEKLFRGTRGKLLFRVAPRSADWAGIVILDMDNKPLPAARGKSGLTITFTDAVGKSDDRHTWLQYDTKALFTDASRVYPQTHITVSRKNELLDEVTIDFTQWKPADSTIRMSDLLDGPTSRHGFVTAHDGAFWRDGRKMFFWGGHENHIPEKLHADEYAETYSDAGLNVQRSIAFEEMIADPATGAIDPAQLDKYHYLIAKLADKGIYFFLTCNGAGGFKNGMWGQGPADGKIAARSPEQLRYYWWVDPRCREAWKKALKTALTTPNPYNGKPIKDDPTVIGFELANETGMNERRFDYNVVRSPEATKSWRDEFNRFLVKKYGSRHSLARAWETNPLMSHEDPAAGTILIPTNYRGSRSPYGGSGQHNQITTPRWYKNGLPADKNPRILDAIEFNKTIAHKPYPFDFNNLTTPKETEDLRIAFNDFLAKKYGGREGLDKAWAEDQLFPWESPEQAIVIDKKTDTKRPDPSKLARTILIPSNYHGELEYNQEFSRLSDPRVSDAIEFTYQVQKTWATDLATFLKNDIGMKCGIGWNGDTFHNGQVANHKANTDSPLDIAIAAAYLDSDNGDQLTSRLKNLKRFDCYGRIFGRPMFAYEWSFWSNQGPFAYEYALLAALMGRTYGFDGYAHHKMAAIEYPVSDPEYSMKVHYITPLTDRPRRGAFEICQWIMQRSKIQENDQRIIIGLPDDSAFDGGPERRMCNWAFENWIMYQLGTEDYSFNDVYHGPTDRIVIHDGRAPCGDYRKARHAILWCHSNTDLQGKDAKAKEKWFALHGITFAPGQKYFINDQFFATTEDLTEYNVVHARAEHARWDALEAGTVKQRKGGRNGPTQYKAADDYWAAEPDAKATEVDQQLYAALKKWGYPMPFSIEEIDKVWRSRDRRMVMDTTRQNFRAERDDMVMWFGKAGPGTQLSFDRLKVTTDEKQYAVALLPWDTADFATARTLCLWCMWNSQVTVMVPQAASAKVYAVNWLGKRLFEVKAAPAGDDAIRFATARHDDIFCFEIVQGK